jgi:hypothetical protein
MARRTRPIAGAAPSRTVAIEAASRDSKHGCIFVYGELDPVPSLIRFLITIGVLAALAYGAMLALVTFVTPQPREMTQTISPTRLNK